MLLSPANTGLLPEDNYRAGVNYRNQWGQIPVPFNTFSAFTDFQIYYDYDQTNWLGVGMSLFNDRAGTGGLALTKVQANTAYHLQLGSYNMLSVGLSLGYVQRSVDFSKLTFDAQWDGLSFDRNLPQNENFSFQKTVYLDIGAGVNYAFFPNEGFYLKIGAGLFHINRPVESFYHQDNKLGMRPVLTADAMIKIGDRWITQLSANYTQQKQAEEMMFGTLLYRNVAARSDLPTVLILGYYHRLGDAAIPVVGIEWNKIQLMASWDITTSELKAGNKGNGAIEFSILYKGLYHKQGRDPSGYSCPRF